MSRLVPSGTSLGGNADVASRAALLSAPRRPSGSDSSPDAAIVCTTLLAWNMRVRLAGHCFDRQAQQVGRVDSELGSVPAGLQDGWQRQVPALQSCAVPSNA